MRRRSSRVGGRQRVTRSISLAPAFVASRRYGGFREIYGPRFRVGYISALICCVIDVTGLISRAQLQLHARRAGISFAAHHRPASLSQHLFRDALILHFSII